MRKIYGLLLILLLMPGFVCAQNQNSKETKAYNETNIQVAQEEIKRLLEEQLKKCYDQLRIKISDFDNLPPSAQQALLVIQFDHGDQFNRQNYPKLFDAIEAKDFEKAAEAVSELSAPHSFSTTKAFHQR